jgi:type I restriction enzyme, R subunit
MVAVISEDSIEQIVIKELQDIGYIYLNGVDISPDGMMPERDFHEVVLTQRLQHAIATIQSKSAC